MALLEARTPDPTLETLFAMAGDRRELRRRAWLQRMGEPLAHAFLVTSGWFGRFRAGFSGAEAFTGVYMPGDVIGLDALDGGRFCDDVAALHEASVLRLPLGELRHAVARGGPAALQIVRLLSADAGFLREALFAVGTQPSLERLATFFLQTHERMIAAGLTLPGSNHFMLPLTQAQLGAVTGLTSVHINRVLKQLRNDGLLSFRNGVVHILDPVGLRHAAHRRA